MADFLAGTRDRAKLGYNRALQNSGGRNVSQGFQTAPVPNFGLALYVLEIRSPSGSNSLITRYTFPLSPESVRKEFRELTNYYDVQGDASNLGVQRVVDIYGQTPCIFMIEGTTGWKMHSTDGFAYTGLESVRVLEQALGEYAQLNQIQIANGNPDMYQIWFYDYFRGDFWQVVPIGVQGLRQSASRPLFVNYSLRMIGVRNLAEAEQSTVTDTLAVLLGGSDQSAAQVMTQFNNSVITNYAGVTAAAQ